MVLHMHVGAYRGRKGGEIAIVQQLSFPVRCRAILPTCAAMMHSSCGESTRSRGVEMSPVAAVMLVRNECHGGQLLAEGATWR